MVVENEKRKMKFSILMEKKEIHSVRKIKACISIAVDNNRNQQQ